MLLANCTPFWIAASDSSEPSVGSRICLNIATSFVVPFDRSTVVVAGLEFFDAPLVTAASLRPEAAIFNIPKNHGKQTVRYRAYRKLRLGHAVFEGAFNQPLPDLFRLFLGPNRFWKCHHLVLHWLKRQKSCPAGKAVAPAIFRRGAGIILSLLVKRTDPFS